MQIPGYEIIRELGRGGMATVYLAVQESFGRKVALKVLDSQAASDQEFAQRFLREAKTVAQLSHPHIVPVYDVGVAEGHYYMSMDYLSGGALPDRLKTGMKKSEVIALLSQIASALGCLHEHGYLHRDIKPDNILFRKDGSGVLTDFGVAKPQNAREALTQAGLVIGTPVYMSPEQINGKALDARTDIYSLGVVLYEILEGEPPYLSDDFLALALKHVQDQLPELTLSHDEFQPILDKCMAKKPEDRFQSCAEFIRALDKMRLGAAPSKASAHSPQSPGPVNQAAQPTPAANTPAAIAAKSKAHPKDKAQDRKNPDGLHFDETMRKKLGIMKRYTLVCLLTSQEAQPFTIYFSRLTTKLIEWYDERLDQAEAITLKFSVSPWLVDKVKHAVAEVYDSGETYAFLHRLSISVEIENLQGTPQENYVLNR